MIRFITTFALAAAVLSAIWYLPLLPFRILILLAVGAGLWEYARLVFPGTRTRLFSVFLGVSFASLMTWHVSFEILLLGLCLTVFLAFLWVLANHEPLQEAAHQVGLLVLGVWYLALTLPFWSWLKEMGREWVMLVLFPACLTDTFGFLVGKTIGRKKLAPIISPNKTWEGFFGSLFGGLFGIWLASKLFPAFSGVPLFRLAILGLGITLVAVLGDLFESLIKRSVRVKDSSHLIPGHGGALDRLDALIFAAPFAYFLLRYGSTIVR